MRATNTTDTDAYGDSIPTGSGGTAGRRIGYVIAIGVNAAILYLANRWPGWEVVPFLTSRTPDVLGIVNDSLIAGIIANIVYVVWDPPRLRAVGDLVTLTIALVATVRVWQVFPFDFSAYAFNWEVVTRVLLVIGIVGSSLGLLGALVNLVRGRRPGERQVSRHRPA